MAGHVSRAPVHLNRGGSGTIPLVCAVLCALLVYTGTGSAQDACTSSRLSGTAFGIASLVEGVDALGVNPALIATRRGSRVSIAVLPLGVAVGTDFLTWSTYRKYFTGVETPNGREPLYLDDADKRYLLSQFHGDVGHFQLEGGFRLFAATVNTPSGTFGVSVNDRFASQGAIPRDFADFLLFGNEPGRTYDFSQTRMSSSWTRDYGITFARRILLDARRRQAVCFGATLKFVHGFGYFSIERFNSRFTTDPDSFVVTGTADIRAQYAGGEILAQKNAFAFSLFPAPAGNGAALDLGFHAQFSEMFMLGVSLTDLGFVQWNRTATEIAATGDFTLSDLSTDAQYEELRRRLNGTEYRVSAFSTPLPTAVTVATSYTARHFLGLPRPLNLGIAVRQGLNDMPGNSTVPWVGVGAEWEFLPAVPLRSGIVYGGGAPAAVALGIGLNMHRVTIDIASRNINTAFSESLSRVSLAVTSRIDF